MNHLFFGIRYMLRYRFSGKMPPLICGLVLHNKCNLHCRHCTVIEQETSSMRFEEAKKVIDNYYAEGGRCLYLEGGEPMIWRDNSHTSEDIVRYAKKKGYYAVIIYTNGTMPLKSEADTIFVSIDGMQKTHDYLRGKSFEKIINNIEHSDHRSIYVNYTINSVNKDDITEFCRFTADTPRIKGTFFYFHTPYYGYDELYLDRQMKNEISEKIIKLKSLYKILNSKPGLRSAIKNDWTKNLDICRVYEDGKYYKCCRENRNGAVCEDCGYLSYAEIDQSLKLRPGAIINAMKYF